MEPLTGIAAHGMKEAFKFQFLRVSEVDNAEYVYTFQYTVPVISTGDSYVVETSHFTLSEVRFSSLDNRGGCHVPSHWRWLSEKDRLDIFATANKYIEAGRSKMSGIVYSWREVFDSSRAPKAWNHISAAVRAAYDGGYPMVAWRDELYSVLGPNDWKITIYSVRNVK